GPVGHIHHNETSVPPAAIGRIATNDGVVQPVAAEFRRPIRLLAGRDIHARQPKTSSLDGILRVAHVDGDQDVIAETVEQGGGIVPASTSIPATMQPAAL